MKVDEKIADKVHLRPLRLQDFSRVVVWSRDMEFCFANSWEPSRAEEELYQWWANCVNGEIADFLRIGIEFEERLVGYADLANIRYGKAEFGIAVGESGLWGKGVGPAAARKLLNYAKETLGMTTIFAETHQTNSRSRKMLQKLDFQEISRMGTELYYGEETGLIQYQKLL